ncbi:Rad17 cell cycle checkpoint protein-domain-containing protein [Xylaria nigripes]|nr:Rad17 cell cycle checkpoint protein-domain-containing protein [Xylaria nigripes]
MAPPAKRRKRTIVQSSSDEEESNPPVNTLNNYLFSSPHAKNDSKSNSPRAITASPSPVRKSSSFVSNQPSKPPLKPLQLDFLNSSSVKDVKKIASTSPEKSNIRPPVRGKSDEKGKSADLVTLFSKQAERAAARAPIQLDDITSDPISDDDDVGEHRAATTSHVGLTARKRFKDLHTGSTTASTAIALSQKFVRPSLPLRARSVNEEQRPWSEMFGPVSLDELAVHKRKVADVRRWLEDVLAGRMRQRLLILKGAAGTGKTTALRLLAKDMRCEILEWRNPTASLGGTQGFQSASAQFEEFLGRGGKFSQLDTNQEDLTTHENNEVGAGSHKIMLIEEFPNTFARSSATITSFRKAVLQFLAINTPSLSLFTQRKSKEPITPVVMIISETLLTTTSASADSFTAHRLLGPEIIRHPGTCIIEFNAIAPTLLAAALELTVQKEARKSGRRRTPGPLVLKKLGEIGDIRSAISSLQFLCLKGDTDADWGSQVSFGKPKRSVKSAVSLTPGEAETLRFVTQREASLGIFHAVGKVVYNKREENPRDPRSPGGIAELLPDHMASCSRPKKSEVSVDSLIDETGTDAHTFISAVHENYVLSCEPTGPSDPNSFLDYMGRCVDFLSESDLLCPSRDVFFNHGGVSAFGFSSRDSASHVLRQEEIAFQVATRGLLFSLPSPVNRRATGPRRGGDAFKMFYPTSLKLWREKEELEGLVDHWSSILLRGDDYGHDITDGAFAFRRPRNTDASHSSDNQISRRNNTKHPEQRQSQSAALLSLGSSARRELLLERLPFMLHIARRRRITGPTVRIKDIERVVSFSGIGLAADEDDVDLDENTGTEAKEAWATDQPTEEASPRKKSIGFRRSSYNGGSVASMQVQKLVLSDDDIEDD